MSLDVETSVIDTRPEHLTPVSSAARGWVLLAAPAVAALLLVLAIAIGIVVTVATLKLSEAQAQNDLQRLVLQYDGQMGLTVLIYLSILAAIWLLLPKSGPASLQSYFRRISVRTAVLALASGISLALLISAILIFLSSSHLVIFHTTAGERALLPHSLEQLEFGLLAVALAGPLVEEVYFRGLLLRWLSGRMPLAVAAIANAALFAGTHFRFTTHVGLEGWVLTGGLFLFGLFASAWAGATRSIWPSFAAHGMYNATLIGLPVIAEWVK